VLGYRLAKEQFQNVQEETNTDNRGEELGRVLTGIRRRSAASCGQGRCMSMEQPRWHGSNVGSQIRGTATILRWWRRSVCSGVAWLPAGRDYTATMEQDGAARSGAGLGET